MEEEESKIVAAGGKLQGSQIGRRRVITTWAVGEAWERFCKDKQHIIIRAFRAVGLGLPIDGSCDAEISIKGLNSGDLLNKLKSGPTTTVQAEPGIEAKDWVETSEKDDENEAIEFEAGFKFLEQ